MFYPYCSCRNAAHNGVVGDVLSHHGVGANGYVVADGHVPKYLSPETEVAVVAHGDAAVVVPLVLVAEHYAGQQGAIAPYADVGTNVDEVAHVVDAQPRPNSAGVDGDVELKSQPLVAEEVPQEQQPVPALVMLHTAQVADIMVYVPVLVAQQPVFDGGAAAEARLVVMRISQIK